MREVWGGLCFLLDALGCTMGITAVPELEMIPCQPLLLPKVPTPAAPTVLENLSGASHPSTSAEIKENHMELREKGKNELCKHTLCSWVVFQEIQRPLKAAGRALVGCWIPGTAAPFIQVPLGYTRAPHLGMCSGETHSQQTKKPHYSAVLQAQHQLPLPQHIPSFPSTLLPIISPQPW